MPIRPVVRDNQPNQPAPKSSAKPVGYKNPPLHTRFKPGQSGNPRGRPKRAQSLKAVILNTLAARITVRTAGGEQKMSKLNALIHKLVELAMKGNARALTILLSLYQSAAPEPSAQEIPDREEDLTATDLAILDALKASWAAEQGESK